MVYRVAADIGGTFTDIVIENTSDKVFSTIKVLSTPQNQAIAVLEGLKKNISNILLFMNLRVWLRGVF